MRGTPPPAKIFIERRGNGNQDILQSVSHLMVPEMQDADSPICEESLVLKVGIEAVLSRVAASVDFYGTS